MGLFNKFYPKIDLKAVTEITPELLKNNGIKAVLLDIDNTLIDYEKNMIEGLENWIEKLKRENYKFCILSNTNSKLKAKEISKKLGIPYIYFATKPFKRGFKKAKEILKIENNNEIAVVGDQILTDVFGANRCNMFSILVLPVKNKDIFITRFNRIIERKILKKYYKEKNESKEV